jgi:hypothetical protein
MRWTQQNNQCRNSPALTTDLSHWDASSNLYMLLIVNRAGKMASISLCSSNATG